MPSLGAPTLLLLICSLDLPHELRAQEATDGMFLFPQGWAQCGHWANVCGKMKGRVMGKEGEKEKEEETKRRGSVRESGRGRETEGERRQKEESQEKGERGERNQHWGGGGEFAALEVKQGFSACLSCSLFPPHFSPPSAHTT